MPVYHFRGPALRIYLLLRVLKYIQSAYHTPFLPYIHQAAMSVSGDKSLPPPSNSGYLPSASMNPQSSTTTAAISVPRASDTTTNRPLVHVKPPSSEDLQPSYARLLPPHEDDGSHNWYGGMINACGSIIGFMGAIPCCKPYLNRLSTGRSIAKSSNSPLQVSAAPTLISV